MNPVIALRHRTDYHYPAPAYLSPQIVRLHPGPNTQSKIRSYSINIDPVSAGFSWESDDFGNRTANVIVADPVEHFGVEVNLEVELTPVNPFDFVLDAGAETMPVEYEPELRIRLTDYLNPEETWSRELVLWFDSLRGTGATTTVATLVEVAMGLTKQISYEVRLDPGVQSGPTTFVRRAGSCRDSAWLLVEGFRRLGLAARFVSGYLIQLATSAEPDQSIRFDQTITGPIDEDSTDLHAWVEVFLPGAGWIGIDPTSGLAVGEGHIPLAAAPTPALAAPISGTASMAAERFSYANTVVRTAG